MSNVLLLNGEAAGLVLHKSLFLWTGCAFPFASQGASADRVHEASDHRHSE